MADEMGLGKTVSYKCQKSIRSLRVTSVATMHYPHVDFTKAVSGCRKINYPKMRDRLPLKSGQKLGQ